MSGSSLWSAEPPSISNIKYSNHILENLEANLTSTPTAAAIFPKIKMAPITQGAHGGTPPEPGSEGNVQPEHQDQDQDQDKTPEGGTPGTTPEVNNDLNGTNQEAGDNPVTLANSEREIQAGQINLGSQTLKSYLDNKFPKHLLGKPANKENINPKFPKVFGPSKQSNEKAIIQGKAICDYICDKNAYHFEEGRRYNEQSRKQMTQEIAFMLVPIMSNVEKLEIALKMNVEQSKHARTEMINENLAMKELITKLSEDTKKGFESLVTTDNEAQFVSLDGFRKGISSDFANMMAESDTKRRNETTELKTSFRAALRYNPTTTRAQMPPPIQISTTPQAGDQAVLASTPGSGQVQQQQNTNGSSDNSNTNANTEANGNNNTNTNTNTNTQPETMTYTRLDPIKDPATGIWAKKYSQVVGKVRAPRTPRTPGVSGQTNQHRQNLTRNTSFEFNDRAKAAEKDKKRKETGESNALREIIIHNAPETNPPDSLREMEYVVQIAEEISTDELGSGGFDILREEIKSAHCSRIVNYGKNNPNGFTGICPLKVKFRSNLTAEKILEAAEYGGLNGRRRKIDIGKYGKLTAEDWKAKKPTLLHIRKSTTYEQRQKERTTQSAYAAQRKAHQEGEEFNRHLRAKEYIKENNHNLSNLSDAQIKAVYEKHFPNGNPGYKARAALLNNTKTTENGGNNLPLQEAGTTANPGEDGGEDRIDVLESAEVVESAQVHQQNNQNDQTTTENDNAVEDEEEEMDGIEDVEDDDDDDDEEESNNNAENESGEDDDEEEDAALAERERVLNESWEKKQAEIKDFEEFSKIEEDAINKSRIEREGRKEGKKKRKSSGPGNKAEEINTSATSATKSPPKSKRRLTRASSTGLIIKVDSNANGKKTNK